MEEEAVEDRKRDAHIAASIKYNATNVKQVKLNLNKKTDADIIERLASEENVQGYIKRLIRKDVLECHHKNANNDSVDR